ncbi:MAG: Hpt domain-containing protein [Roseburia sp.]
MNRYLLTKVGINVQEGIHRFAGKKEVYEKYLYDFLENEYYDKLEDAIRERNGEEAFQAAHALKGVAGNLSLNPLFEAIKPVVEKLRGKADFEQAEKMMEGVREQYQFILDAIRKSKEEQE